MATHRADVVVVGGGAMGTAAGWALARQGINVAVLEQFSHVHGFGSHGSRTRIFRHAYAEGATYVPWTLEADRLWSGLQERTGQQFIHRTGCLDISAPGFHRAHDARASAVEYELAHEWLTGAEVRARWPIWNIDDSHNACFDPDAGFLDVEIGLRALAGELAAAGSTITPHTRVISWDASVNGVEIQTAADDRWLCQAAIVTAGAWAGKLLAELSIPLEVRRKPVGWFEVAAEFSGAVEPNSMPVYICEDANGEFYGFPHYVDEGIKVGMHSGGLPVDPDTIDRNATIADTHDDILPFARKRLRGITGRVCSTAVCMYTMSADEDFIIDRHPETGSIVLAAGFSGHGFKFAPVVGEYLASLVTDPSREPIALFGLARFSGT